MIEQHVKSIGRIVQKRTKGNNLRFQLLPIRENSSQRDSNSEKSNSDSGPLWLAVCILVILVTKYVLLKKYYFDKTDSGPISHYKEVRDCDELDLTELCEEPSYD